MSYSTQSSKLCVVGDTFMRVQYVYVRRCCGLCTCACAGERKRYRSVDDQSVSVSSTITELACRGDGYGCRSGWCWCWCLSFVVVDDDDLDDSMTFVGTQYCSSTVACFLTHTHALLFGGECAAYIYLRQFVRTPPRS